MTDLLGSLKKTEYTGANRCTPCTAVNVVIAAVLAVAVGAVFVPLGVVAFLASLAAIYLRGYLVPGTPTLTKRYFPDRVLAYFDKAERPGSVDGPVRVEPPAPDDAATNDETESDPETSDPETSDPTDTYVNPERLLADAGVVEECADEEDLCLSESFTDAWRDAVDRLRDDPDAREAAAADLFDRETVRIEFDKRDRLVARVTDGDGDWRLNVWPSEGALVADLAAATELAARVEGWTDVEPAQRAGIAKALRSFMPECPLCEGPIAMTEETVDSCCRSFDVLAVRCTDCEAHYLEIDPQSLEEAAAAAGDANDPGADRSEA